MWIRIRKKLICIHNTAREAWYKVGVVQGSHTVNLHRSDAKYDTWCCSVWHHEVSTLALMLNLTNLTLGVPCQASQTFKFSIMTMLMFNLALVESKKDYSPSYKGRIVQGTYNLGMHHPGTQSQGTNQL
jgi:hypothetical protein